MNERRNLSNELEEILEQEKSRDRMTRRISITAWGVTIVTVLLYGMTVFFQTFQYLGYFNASRDVGIIFQSVTPLLIVIGTVSLLIAVLFTIGVFLRLRTASLKEIQMRLASLEGIIVAQEDKVR